MKNNIFLLFVFALGLFFCIKIKVYDSDSIQLDLNSEGHLEQIFELWEKEFSITQFKSVYISQAERYYRIKVFQNNYKDILNHNSKLGKPYKLGINQFIAITKQQFKAQYLSSYHPHQDDKQSVKEQVGNLNIDWIFQKAVTPVKNQGKCAANYAYAVVGAMQGLSAIFGNRLQQYSAQQIIDCTSSYGNSQCDGGELLYVYLYLHVFNNILQSDYPWVGQPGNCQAKQSNKRLKTFGVFGSCGQMQLHLRKTPVSVVVDGQNMQFYKQGIFNNCQANLSLPLLLVGLTDSYYTLKNSWGTTWGQNGFIRINKGNTCGVCMSGYYPVPI